MNIICKMNNYIYAKDVFGEIFKWLYMWASLRFSKSQVYKNEYSLLMELNEGHRPVKHVTEVV